MSRNDESWWAEGWPEGVSLQHIDLTFTPIQVTANMDGQGVKDLLERWLGAPFPDGKKRGLQISEMFSLALDLFGLQLVIVTKEQARQLGASTVEPRPILDRRKLRQRLPIATPTHERGENVGV